MTDDLRLKALSLRRAAARPYLASGALRSLADRPRLVVGALTLLAAALRAWHLDWMSLWQDEGLSLYRATKDLDFILSGTIYLGDLATRDVQPPLYFLLLAGWFRLVGVGIWLGKWLSFLAGLPTIALVWALARRWVGRPSGYVASLLAALSPVYLWYSQELRSYTLVVSLALLAVYGLDRVLAAPNRPERVGWSVLCALSNVLLVWTHYLGFFLLAFQVPLVAVHLRKRWDWRALTPLLLLAVAAVPLLPFGLRRLGIGPETDQSYVPLRVMLQDVAYGFTLGWTADPPAWAVGLLAVSFGAIALVGATWLWRTRTNASLKLVSFLLLPLFALWAATLLKPVYMGVRHILLVSPPFYILMAVGIVSLANRKAILGFAVGVACVGAMLHADWNFYSDPSFQKDDLRGLAEYVNDRALDGDILAVSDSRLVLTFEHLLDSTPVVAVPYVNVIGLADDRPPGEQLAPLLEYRRIWFMTPHPPLRSWLEETDADGRPLRATHSDRHYFHGRDIPVGVDAYDPIPSPLLPEATRPEGRGLAFGYGQKGEGDAAEPAEEPGLGPTDGWHSPDEAESWSFGGLVLERWRISPDPLVSGRPARAELVWRADREVPDYKIALRLLDKSGESRADGDHAPFHGLRRASEWPLGESIYEPHDLAVEPGTESGRYEFGLVVYDPATGDAIPEVGSRVLGEVRVSAPGSPIDPRALEVGQRMAVRGDGLELFGFDSPVGQAVAGERVRWTAWLRPLRAVTVGHVRVSLLDRWGRVAASGVSRPIVEAPGRIIRLPIDIDLPLEGGKYTVRAELLELGAPIGLRDRRVPVRAAWLGWIRLSARAASPPPSPEAVLLDIPVGSDLVLQSVLVEPEGLKPGATITTTLYWLAVSATSKDYRSTVQVLPVSGPRGSPEALALGTPVAQHDGVPAGGMRPTTGWRPGETIADLHKLEIPEELTEGRYVLIAALYDPAEPAAPRPEVVQETVRRDFAVLDEFVVGPARSGEESQP